MTIRQVERENVGAVSNWYVFLSDASRLFVLFFFSLFVPFFSLSLPTRPRLHVSSLRARRRCLGPVDAPFELFTTSVVAIIITTIIISTVIIIIIILSIIIDIAIPLSHLEHHLTV